MDAALKRAIARAMVGTNRGTGFLVAPDGFVTALHVLADTRVVPADGVDLDASRYAARASLRFGDPDLGDTLECVAEICAQRVKIDAKNDQALVPLSAAPGVEPLRASRAIRDGDRWETFGFPEDAREQGLVVRGTVTDASRGQLFCEEASAGDGLSVGGLSGAPCIVGGRVVGIITDSLGPTRQVQKINRGGTLFFRPLRLVTPAWPDEERAWLTELFPAQFEVLASLLGVTLAESSQPERAETLLRTLGPARRDELLAALRRVGARTPS